MAKKIIDVPIHKFTIQQNDSRFLKLELWLATIGENLNKSYIDKSAYELSKNTIEYIPMCGILKDGKFLGHEDNEKPFGCVLDLNNNNYRYEIDPDNGLEYVVVDSLIFKQYCPDIAEQILKDDDTEKISMEIEVKSGYMDRKKKVYHITEFVYNCVTIIGVESGMEGAHLQVKYNKEEYSNYMKDIKEELAFYFSTQNNKNINTDNSVDINNKNKKEDNSMKFNKEEFAQKFGLTANQMYDELYKLVCSQEKYIDEYWQEECCRYYMRDFDEEFVYASDYKMCIVTRVPYTMNGDNPSLDFEKAERVKNTWTLWESASEDEGMDDMDEMVNFEKEQIKKIKDFEKEIETLKSEKETKETEFANLKTDYDKISEEKSTKETSYIELSEKFSSLEKEIASKDEIINNSNVELERLHNFEKDTKSKEKQVKADVLYAKYKDVLTEDDVKTFNEKLDTYEDMEKFEKDIKSVVCDKYELKNKQVKTDLSFSYMSLPTDNTQPKNPINKWAEYNKEYNK